MVLGMVSTEAHVKIPKRPRFSGIKAGRAIFNAASELCKRVHPASYHNGNSCCGICYEVIAFTINNPVKKGRVDWWSDFVQERENELFKVDYYLKSGVMVPVDKPIIR